MIITPGYQFNGTEEVTTAKLNALGKPGIVLESTDTPGGGGATATVTLASAQRLKTVSLTASTVEITADAILAASSTASKILTGVDVTIDSTASGANGVESGLVTAVSTWYYLWVIAKGDGTVAGLLSASSSAPTLPTGYTLTFLAGMVFLDASQHITPFLQMGQHGFWKTPVLILNAVTPTAANTWLDADAQSVVPVANGVPPGAVIMTGTQQLYARPLERTLSLSTDASGNYVRKYFGVISSDPYAGNNTGDFSLPGDTRKIYYQTSTTTNGIKASLWITGFTLPVRAC